MTPASVKMFNKQNSDSAFQSIMTCHYLLSQKIGTLGYNGVTFQPWPGARQNQCRSFTWNIITMAGRVPGQCRVFTWNILSMARRVPGPMPFVHMEHYNHDQARARANAMRSRHVEYFNHGRARARANDVRSRGTF